jgi:hypothetical protein
VNRRSDKGYVDLNGALALVILVLVILLLLKALGYLQ